MSDDTADADDATAAESVFGFGLLALSLCLVLLLGHAILVVYQMRGLAGVGVLFGVIGAGLIACSTVLSTLRR